jgi:hypothetical protein
MAFHASARTHTFVRTPLRAKGSSLLHMLIEGDLTVNDPGLYDIRPAGFPPPRESVAVSEARP